MSARNRIKKRGLLGRAAGLAALCGPLIVAAPAFSQNAAGSNDQSQSAASQNVGSNDQAAVSATGALQEVVVTAERRSTDIQTTPISIQAISGTQLQSEQITSVTSLQQVAPNLTVNGSAFSENINVRGIGMESAGADNQGGVIVIHDGLPNPGSGGGLNAPYYDMADVEVLRGPQGTFIGDNSTGGAITINSANPNFNGVNGFLDAEVATYSDQRFQGALNLPISDTAAMRFAFNEETRGSFYYDEGAEMNGPYLGGPDFGLVLHAPDGFTPGLGQTYGTTRKTIIDPGNVDNKNARLSVLWKPTDNLQSLTKVEFNYDDSDGSPGQPNILYFDALPGVSCPSGAASPIPGKCQSRYAYAYSGSPYVLNNINTNLSANQSINLYSEELKYTLPDGIQLRSMSGDQEINYYSAGGGSGTYVNTQSVSYSSQTDHIYSEEVDAISPTTGKLSWIAGGTWIYHGAQYGSYSANGAAPYTPADPAVSEWEGGEYLWAKTEGVFAQVSYQILPTLQLQIGGRMNWDDDQAVGCDLSDRPPPYTSAITCNTFGYLGSTPTDKFGLNWTPIPGQFFYAFFARGYKPGLENLGDEPATHKESDRDYELGWKGRLADGHITTQLGGYYMQYYGMLETIFNPYNATGSSTGNVPFSIVKGIEANMQAHVGQLSVNLNAAYNKSILGPLVDAATYKFPPIYGITNQCTGGEVPNSTNSNCTNYNPFLVNLGGESLPYAPVFSAHATLLYAIPLSGTMSLEPRVVYSYEGNSYSSLFQSDDYYLLPSHSLWDGFLDWNAGPWTTTVFATNLANTVYWTGGGYDNPRQVGLEVHRTF